MEPASPSRQRKKNMKVLILSCSTGEGHNSAAYAVSEALERKGAECVLCDPVGFQSERAKNIVSAAYNNLIKKVPAAFGVIYKAGDWYSGTELPSPIYHANSHYADKLYEYIMEEGFDAVVSTHLYGMEAMTAIYDRTALNIPCYGVLTDYTCIPFFGETRITKYFIPHKDLKAEMMEKGIPEERILATGIPVREQFRETLSRQQARNYLALPQDQKVILIMTGGIGGGNAAALCRELRRRADGDTLVFVLCGRNSELKERIGEEFGGTPQIQAVTFTKKVSLYMKAADVLLSKPGGISSSEAAAMGVPLVHTMAIPGCETKNAEFFEARGLSVNAPSLKAAAEAALRIANDPTQAERMAARQRETICPDGAKRIAEYILEAYHE